MQCSAPSQQLEQHTDQCPATSELTADSTGQLAQKLRDGLAHTHSVTANNGNYYLLKSPQKIQNDDPYKGCFCLEPQCLSPSHDDTTVAIQLRRLFEAVENNPLTLGSDKGIQGIIASTYRLKTHFGTEPGLGSTFWCLQGSWKPFLISQSEEAPGFKPFGGKTTGPQVWTLVGPVSAHGALTPKTPVKNIGFLNDYGPAMDPWDVLET